MRELGFVDSDSDTGVRVFDSGEIFLIDDKFFHWIIVLN